jgi:ferredoxin
MIIRVDANTCIGTGNCVFNAPGVFDQAEDGTSIVVDITAQPIARIRFAAESCPVKAITVEDS